MSAFEFFFSFYGLLLGLCVAKIANGVGHALVVRRESRFGWLTPMLAAFILLDLASFWYNAWDFQKVIGVSAVSIYSGMAIALSYYLAVALLFPVQAARWDDLDDHYWANKRLVVLGIAAANAATLAWFLGAGIFQAPMVFYAFLGFYWIPLLTLLVSRRAWLDGVCLGLLIATYVATTVQQISGVSFWPFG